jgi:hypothetical protein
MPSRYITFVLPFNDSNNSDGYNSDFENSHKPKKEIELNLNKEILLFKDNNPNLNSKPEDRTSFIDIKEYLMEIALVKPLELPPTKIPILASDRPPPVLKSRVLPNIRTKIQALTLLQE